MTVVLGLRGWYKRGFILLTITLFLLLPIFQILAVFVNGNFSNNIKYFSFLPRNALLNSLLFDIPWWNVHSSLILLLISYRLISPLIRPKPKTASSLTELQEEVEEIERATGCKVTRSYFTTKVHQIPIHYQTIGSGQIVLLCGNGLGKSCLFSHISRIVHSK